MKPEARLFLLGAPFFALMAAIYGFWTAADGRLEPVGTAAILLTALLVGMIGAYLEVTSRHIDPRPEDDPDGEIAQGAGDQGVFAPWSWWPLAIGFSSAVVFLGLAIGWWMVGVGCVLGLVALVGWVFEFSRGQHAH